MEVIVLILIVVLAIASSRKKKQGRTAKAPLRAAGAIREAVERAKAEAERTAAPAQREAENQAALERAREKAALRAAAAKLQRQAGMPGQPAAPRMSQGESSQDDEGCVGGSLPHDHAEGERREEHDRHRAAMEAREREEAAMDHAGIDARQLRRAVVMAEILDRPRALRMRWRLG